MVRILFIIFISRKNSKLERKKDLLVIQFYFREILDFGFWISDFGFWIYLIFIHYRLITLFQISNPQRKGIGF